MTIEKTFENSEEAKNGLPGLFGNNVEITTNEGVYTGIIRSQGYVKPHYTICDENNQETPILYSDTNKVVVLKSERKPGQNL